MRSSKNPDMSFGYVVKVLMEQAKKTGMSYRSLDSGHEAEKIRQQLKYQMKIDDTFDWSGYAIGRKKNPRTNKVMLYVTNDTRKLPAELKTETFNKMDALLRYAVNILCEKQYMGIVALPKMRSYMEAQKYLETKCRERLGYAVTIVIEQDPDSRGYHARIYRKGRKHNDNR